MMLMMVVLVMMMREKGGGARQIKLEGIYSKDFEDLG